MSVQIKGDNVFTKEMANVFETEVIECPDCGFEFGCKHEQANENGIYVCPVCRECNLEVEIKKLKEQLQAKVTLINNGWEEERYGLQEENNKLRTALHELEVFKNHAELLLAESQYEYLEKKTQMHLLREKADV